LRVALLKKTKPHRLSLPSCSGTSVACTSRGDADKACLTLTCLQFLTHKLLHCVTCEYKNRNSFHVFELKTIVLVTTAVSKFRLSNTQGGKEGNTVCNHLYIRTVPGIEPKVCEFRCEQWNYSSSITESSAS
jgi:hypothetical protein